VLTERARPLYPAEPGMVGGDFLPQNFYPLENPAIKAKKTSPKYISLITNLYLLDIFFISSTLKYLL